MNRDNLLFTVIGVLFGFVSGYFVHEVVAARQPQRVLDPVAALAGAAPGGMPPQSGQPGAGMPQPTQPANPAATQVGPGGMEEIQRLRQWVADNPQDADAVLTLANLNYDIQNWSKARELYEQYLGLRPEHPDILTDLGVCLRQVGDPRAALARFNRAQEIDVVHWASRFNEVVVLAFDLGEFDPARAVIEELRTLQPGNAEVERLAAEIERRATAGVG